MLAPHRLLVLIALLGLIACSDDSATNPDADAPAQSSATIQPQGGSISIENENGVSLQVTLPAGAVLAPTRITLRAVDPPAGTKARFAIEPAGLDLLQPATFVLKIPDGMTLRESFGLAFTSGEQVAVPTEVDLTGRTLSASLFHLGFDLPAPPAAAAARVALDGAGNEFIDMQDFECQLARDQLTDAILRAQAFSGAFPPDLASPLIQQYRAALLVCESADSVAAASETLREYACANINSAEATASVVLAQTIDDLRNNLGVLLAAEGMAQEFGANCHIQTATMESEFDEFLTAYVDRINGPGFTRNFPTWNALWAENLVIVGLLALAQEYGVQPAVDRINNEVFPALFARLHEVASAACDVEENNTFLLDLITGGYALSHPITLAREVPSFSGLPADEIVDETLRCGSSLRVEGRANDNLLLDSATIRIDDQGGSVRVTDNGKVVVTDNTLGFTCNGIVSRPPIRVRAEVPQHLPVVALGNLSGTLSVSVGSTLSALPAPGQGELPSSFDIVIERDRNLCGTDAEGTLELARIQVNATGFLGSMSGTWSGNCESGAVAGEFTINVASDRTVTGTYTGSATGTIEGLVNSNGTFNASASGTAGPCTWSGSLSLQGGGLSGSGTWSCGEAGCSGSYQSGSSN